MSWSLRALSRHGSLALLAVVLACGGDSTGPATPKPAALTLITSAAVNGTAGQPLAPRVTVKVTSASGDPVPGITVSFVAASNSGTVAVDDAATKADGTAAATWTLGTVAGDKIDTLRASISELPGKSVAVVATVKPGAPNALTIVSGDQQPGTPGALLPQPLVVVARDALGNPTSGAQVGWTVEGGGSLSATSTVTDSDGTSSVTWTLGAGTNRAHAKLASLSATPLTFTASFTSTGAVVLTSVSPATLVEGQSATLTGSGFSATVANDAVFIDGVGATVTSASATSLTVTVPTYDCRPPRSVDVRVAVSGDNSNTVSDALTPVASTLNLPVGQQLILQDPAGFCVQFAETSAPETYLVGVQSVSELVSSMTPVALSAASAQTVVASTVPNTPWPALLYTAQGNRALPVSPTVERWDRQRTAEARIRMRERQLVRPGMIAGARQLRARAALSPSGTLAASAVPATAKVGDTIQVHVPDVNSDNFCQTFIPITTVVRAVGTRGIWLEDVANPSGGFTASDFQTLSDLFDNAIYDADTQEFGAPTDFDGNGHIVIVTTKEVNKVANVLGFVVSTDLVPTTTCPASNDGEFYYGRAPDTTSSQFTSPEPYPVSTARLDAQKLIAHEFTHVIQFGRRLDNPNATDFPTPWEAEGQATLAEEIVGNRLTGRSTAQNYGFAVAFDNPRTSDVDWYSDRFIDLAVYFGFRTSTSKVSNAPEQCSWLDTRSNGNTGPCLSGREVYGVPWSFLRWLSDQFGPTFPGGEAGLQQALIDDTHSGFATIENVVKVPMDSLLAQWSAMLYVDDRVQNAAPRLTLPSWNMNDIFSALVAPAQLEPRTRSFTTFTDTISVRGGSTAYYLVGGSGRAATALRARDLTGNPLPANMQMWVVRVQ
ncbi:MAG TPA: Ig-like domain-containing protein [Gemmatimonadaceae bacterium]|nr:Ig-like domain-containing protein [Gemmatimonadaceae bacterium]